jgi:hypothetical protein
VVVSEVEAVEESVRARGLWEVVVVSEEGVVDVAIERNGRRIPMRDGVVKGRVRRRSEDLATRNWCIWCCLRRSDDGSRLQKFGGHGSRDRTVYYFEDCISNFDILLYEKESEKKSS